MKLKKLYNNFDQIKSKAQKISLSKKEKWVIFSDLHLGDGTYKDDFKRNAKLYSSALQYYLAEDYGMILNGDVEELQRFKYQTIRKTYSGLFKDFEKFQNKRGLLKTFGNHDIEFSFNEEINSEFPTYEAIVLEHKEGEILIFHGHQASDFYIRYNHIIGWLLKHIATPLGFNNYSVAHDSKRKYKIEQRVYHYSAYKGIVSIIGHTHRPLFESLSKAERLKIMIENLVREYVSENNEKRVKEIKKTIKSHKKELKKIYRKRNKEDLHHLYGSSLHIPCLFNSGSAIGKRGITCLEIAENKIRLVHWFNKNTSERYLNKRGYEPQNIGDQDTFKMVLNEESLNYIFARIKLLK